MKTSDHFEEKYGKLNAKQKQAVDAIAEGRPVLVVAGPGSGKTQVLSMSVAKILQEAQILASNILCLTFTDSAATNMRDRLSKLIGSEAYRVSINTFHSFCTGIIERYPEHFWHGAKFLPADKLTQVSVIEEIISDLPLSHPLRSEHPEQGFIYVWPILKAISFIKKAGLNPAEFKSIIEHNKESLEMVNEILQPIFSERLSKVAIKIAKDCVPILQKKAKEDSKKKPFPVADFKPLLEIVALSLSEAVSLAEEENSTKPLSEWKADWWKKDDDGTNLFKDARNIDKLLALADVYDIYRQKMFNKGFYDFDDMILDCIHTLESVPSLLSDLHEQFQYILVDEFQDTNKAQMRLIRLLADAKVNEGRPNLLVVGDDDQAVYKFQGAQSSNMFDFKNMWKDVEIVTLVDNYRSTQKIVDATQHLIRKSSHRLDRLLPNIEKSLKAANKDLKDGAIIHKEFDSSAHEYFFVASEIKRKIAEGTKPEDIAVIARQHSNLEALVPYMKSADVSIRYEREQNVFKEPHIAELITMSRFISSLVDKHIDEADEYLPRILSFPFWGLDREVVWQISLAARKDKDDGGWLNIMKDYKIEAVRDIANFLIDLGVRAQTEPLELILDTLIGAHVPLGVEDSDEDSDDPLKENKKPAFTSPFKAYYFNKERFTHTRAEYLAFLSSLRVFVRALREYRQGEPLFLKDLVTFVDIHQKNKIDLNDQSPFARLPNAVCLLTAHKAKGLEFDTVFVLSCTDKIWAGRGSGMKISLPINLPIEPAGDTFDDQLRLFYVALTRAKRHLYLTTYTTDEDGKDASRLQFLVAGEQEKAEPAVLYAPEKGDKDMPDIHDILTASSVSYHTAPFRGDEKALLKSLLQDYQLSVTHLNNFLNVEKGGPQYFLENNLLRFPQAKTASGAYGSAVHQTLEDLLLTYKKSGKFQAKADFIETFKKNLKRERLHPDDTKLYLQRGEEALSKFYDDKKESFKADDLVEVNFRDQGVTIGGAKLNGKIDRIVKEQAGEMSVHDYKTGKAFAEWGGKSDYEKTKLYEYERQLLFYKILVENSREFSGKAEVRKGVLEFVEPVRGQIVDLPLDLTSDKIERLEKLIAVVYAKIEAVDFPDISKYDKNLNGTKAFEEDLINGLI